MTLEAKLTPNWMTASIPTPMKSLFQRPWNKPKLPQIYSCSKTPKSSLTSISINPPVEVEVEVKLRLPNSNSHQKLSNLLSPFHIKTLIQENIFFDAHNSVLASNCAALRLRFYNFDSYSVLSLKSNPKLARGISRVEEQEEPIDPSLARNFLIDPSGLLGLASSSQIMKRVKDEFGADELACLGGFKNVRGVYDWKGLKLELDETIYDFGVSYEVECESKEPERDKKLIEGFLGENGIDFVYSDVNKFAVFLSGKLPS